MVYEYRTYQLIQRRAAKEEKEAPPRAMLAHKDKTGFGILLFLCLIISGSSIVYQSMNKQNYGSCVYGKVQSALQNAKASNTRISTQKVCEQAKGVCSTTKTEPPCAVVCSDKGMPDTSQCN